MSGCEKQCNNYPGGCLLCYMKDAYASPDNPLDFSMPKQNRKILFVRKNKQLSTNDKIRMMFFHLAGYGCEVKSLEEFLPQPFLYKYEWIEECNNVDFKRRLDDFNRHLDDEEIYAKIKKDLTRKMLYHEA